ncbi:MAG: hypothetical protein Fur0024_4920 [Patescibacteria group bacterium]
MNLKNFEKEKEIGIWRWEKFFSEIPKLKLSLNEGKTSLEKYNFLKNDFFVKREDKNPTGSHKIRGIAYQISMEIQNIIEKNQNLDFTISTSGNAGVAVSEILREFNKNLYKKNISTIKPIKLFVFVPKFIEERKLIEMQKNPNCIIKICDEPKKESLMMEKRCEAKSIRQSTSPFATEGFKTLAFEIFEDAPMVENIFFPVSSGTSMLGTFYGFLDLQKLGIIQKIPNFIAVQTTKVFPIVKEFFNSLDTISEDSRIFQNQTSTLKDFNFYKNENIEQNHPASAISDYICHRKKEIFEQIRNSLDTISEDSRIFQNQTSTLKDFNFYQNNKSKFFATAISSKETFEARKILEEKFGLFVSYESALTFSAWQKFGFPKNSVLMSSGKK